MSLSVAREIGRVGILGGGLMGTGIAETAARAGFPVCLFEPVEAHRSDAAARLGASLDRAQRAGRLTVEEQAAASDRVSFVESLDDLAGCDLVIEAVVEDRDVKLEWFARLDAAVREAIDSGMKLGCGHPMGPLQLCGHGFYEYAEAAPRSSAAGPGA